MKNILLRMLIVANFRYLVLLTAFSSYGQGYIAASRYLGGSGSENIQSTVVVNGEMYISGTTNSPDFPVSASFSNGLSGDNDFFITKLSANGTIIWSRLLGGTGKEGFVNSLVVRDGSVFIAGHTYSLNYPVTNGSTPYDVNDLPGYVLAYPYYTKLNATTGAIQFSTYLNMSEVNKLVVDTGNVYLFGQYKNITEEPNVRKPEIMKYTINTDTPIFDIKLGSSSSGDKYAYMQAAEVVNNVIYFLGSTDEADFPVTDGSFINSDELSYTYYAKLDADTGNILFATFVGQEYDGSVRKIIVEGDGVYIHSHFDNGNGGNSIYKYDVLTDSLQYHKEIISDWYLFMIGVENNKIYFGSNTSLLKLDAATGDSIIHVTFPFDLGFFIISMEVKDGEIYYSGQTSSDTFPTTNGSVLSTPGSSSANKFDLFLLKINTDNQICFFTYLGGNDGDRGGSSIVLEDDIVYIMGTSYSPDYPVTNGISLNGYSDVICTQLKIPSTANVLTPGSQSICNIDLMEELSGPELLSVPSGDQPLVYRNGVSSSQPAIIYGYQWQQASAESGPWARIPGATQLSYSPQPGSDTTYYRRAVTLATVQAPVGISTVAMLVMNTVTVPDLSGQGVTPDNTYKTNGSITLSGFKAGTAYKISYRFDGRLQTPVTFIADAAGEIKMTGFTKGTYAGFSFSKPGSVCPFGEESNVYVVLTD